MVETVPLSSVKPNDAFAPLTKEENVAGAVLRSMPVPFIATGP